MNWQPPEQCCNHTALQEGSHHFLQGNHRYSWGITAFKVPVDGNFSLSSSLPQLLFQPANLHRLRYLVWMFRCFHKPLFPFAAPARSLHRGSSSYQHMQAWDVSIAAWDTMLAGRQCRLLCRGEYLYKNYKMLFGSQGSGRVCLRLLVRSSSVSLLSFRPWFSTVS